ncbi:DNA-binding response regulator, OmpR family, contains REC and winged-helix (wHTH) domain [Granulicatella balaenopterae]|uniref:DNA-binding response regulator, OmpR family, contains REC and winged-helix (WHTH) domain n=1 Tax=Granulicatella balaenopterae TaxID=137733 RepID=A0A1H9HDP8_9LACT|nr:response regulator transcription factor [Granulicatella balaenopterae]SEQ60404.1 DNA-binding response regulator, OmpR family, contains REC and winged-helix (wHTH) domain [Granulicatella balaenopterae]
MHRIFVVEDDPVISQAVEKALVKWGYQVGLVKDFSAVYQQFIEEKPQLVIMDITLPYFNGFYWCQEIRKTSNVPILFLSSHDTSTDVVMSINMGADDYIMKPFDMTVLVAKVQALLRRSYQFVTVKDWLDYEGLTLHLGDATLSFEGDLIDLTKNEFLIMKVLFEQAGKYVSRTELMQELWNSEWFIDDNTLSVNVARLRKKLEDHGIKDMIATKKGLGYGLVPHD